MSSNTSVTYPAFFVNRWKEKKGYDPLAARDANEKYRSWSMVGIGALLVIVVTLLALVTFAMKRHWPLDQTNEYTAIVMLIAVIASAFLIPALQYKAENHGCKYKRFEKNMNSLAARLRLQLTELLALCDQFTLAAVALKRLRAMAAYIVVIEKIPGSEAEVTVQWLRRSFQDHLELFQEWGVVSANATVGDFFPK